MRQNTRVLVSLVEGFISFVVVHYLFHFTLFYSNTPENNIPTSNVVVQCIHVAFGVVCKLNTGIGCIEDFKNVQFRFSTALL